MFVPSVSNICYVNNSRFYFVDTDKPCRQKAKLSEKEKQFNIWPAYEK